jgi:hypothetical protein
MAILDKLLGRNTMSETLTKIVVDCTTGAVEELPLTAEEIAQREADAAAWAEQKAAEEAEEATLAAAKQSAQEKLKSLGLTDTEIAALTGI